MTQEDAEQWRPCNDTADNPPQSGPGDIANDQWQRQVKLFFDSQRPRYPKGGRAEVAMSCHPKVLQEGGVVQQRNTILSPSPRGSEMTAQIDCREDQEQDHSV